MKGPALEMMVPWGRCLLLGSFGWTLVLSMRRRLGLEECFERLVVGMIALSLYDTAAAWLDALSAQLAGALSGVGQEPGLKSLLLDAFQKAAQAPTLSGSPTSFNVPALLEQAWRTGVWGVMSALVDGVFLVISFVLECAHDVLWQLVLFVFPLAAGLFPVLPGLAAGLLVYAIELSLWIPMLCLVERVTGEVAKTHLTEMGSLGLTVVGVELVAIVLILSIPVVTHRFMHGALTGDFGAQASGMGWFKAVAISGRTKLLHIEGGAQ